MLHMFSTLNDPNGYADDSISNDLVTEAYLEFNARGRQEDSEKYM